MVEMFDEQLYLPDPSEPVGVLPWGKSPELTDQDLAAFQARIGKHRTPNYGQSYLLAANTLLRTAIEARQLDHHALPIFFLQRHAAELIIKAPLQFALEIQKFRESLAQSTHGFPVDDDQRKRAEGSHDLKPLLVDLEMMALALQVGLIPDALRSAVAEIDKLEKQHTWSRYSFRFEGRGAARKLVNHMHQEHILPLGKIQDLLQAAANGLGTSWPLNGLLMSNLGYLWERLAREAGEFD